MSRLHPRLALLAAIVLLALGSSPAAAVPRPPNDDFSSAVPIGALPYSTRLDVSRASRSGTDPGPYCFSGPTVWFVFANPTLQMLRANTAGSDYPAGFEVYRQTDSGLQLITCAYDPSMAPAFQVESGATYYFMVGPSTVEPPRGSLQFNLSSLGAPPANDTRSGAIDISPGTVNGDSTGATSDADDYGPCYMAGASVWYRFVAPADGRYRASVSATTFNAMINTKELGDAGLVGLTCINAHDVPTFFPVRAGVTYYVVVGNATGQLGGPFTLTFAEAPEINPVVTVDPAGMVDRPTGGARITGTVRCNEPAAFALGVLVDQRGTSASAFETIGCGPTLAAWSILVAPDAGAFGPGPATARAGGTAYASFDSDYAQEVSRKVSLRS